ncbi:hypothetical protein K440DRAFT_620926 [Wilcoxina mikolae CBS 423.85]|nr:hypothetical protein K440DRAFT_620926 [Wilcoxina mikolae CBS 423.85]
MEKVTHAASSAADTVRKAIWSDSTHRDGTVTGSETGHTQRAGDTSRTTGDSVASDYPRDESSTGKYQLNSPSTPMRHTGGTQSSTFETGSEFSSGPSDTYAPKAGLTGGRDTLAADSYNNLSTDLTSHESTSHRDDHSITTTTNSLPGLVEKGDFAGDRDHITSSSAYGNTGPHQSNIANKLDPRVDSDRDHRGAATTSSHSNDHSTGFATGSNNPFRSERTEVYPSNTSSGSQHDHSKGGLMAASGLATGSTNDGPHSSNIANKLDPRVDSDRDHRGTTGGFSSSNTSGSTSTNAGPHQSNVPNELDPRVDSDRDHRDATTTTSYSSGTRSGTSTSPYHGTPDSGDVRSVDDPKGPTHTELSTNTATGHDSPFQGIPTSERPGESSSSTGLTSQAGNDTSARKSTVGGSGSDAPSTLTGSAAGGPGAQTTPSVGADPSSGNSPHQKHQGASRPMDEPSTSDPRSGLGGVGHRKSVPLVEGHPESSGPKTHPSGEKLPSGPGTGEGTGTQYVRSSGVVADGGDFDAAAPGAGREADRLLDGSGVHHGADVKDKTHGTTPGKPSLGERIKEKLHRH